MIPRGDSFVFVLESLVNDNDDQRLHVMLRYMQTNKNHPTKRQELNQYKTVLRRDKNRVADNLLRTSSPGYQATDRGSNWALFQYGNYTKTIVERLR